MQRRKFSLGMALGAMVPMAGCSTWQKRTPEVSIEWRRTLEQIEKGSQGRLGVAMLDTGSGLSLGWRQGERFAMCSTFKVPLAAWILSLVDQGNEQLDAKVRYPASELVEYSPVTGPKAGIGGGLSVAQLCAATVSLSDNTAANLLLARHGGPSALTAWLRLQGDSITRLDRNEPTLNEAAVGDERDTTTPEAMLKTMQLLLVGNAISPTSRTLLLRWMIESKTGDKRLRAGAPGWLVGDKTGSAGGSGTANDIGVLWPPTGGSPVLIACYLTRSSASPERRDTAIADVARAALAVR